MSSKRHETGAALVIAIAIMTILLAIALTFFALTRVEVQTATNVTHGVRADHLADAAIAMAVHMLNEDFQRNPNATSTDHSWRSFFSGAAFAGKQWAMRGGQWLGAGGVPQVDMTQPIWVRFREDGHIEQLYRGEKTRHWLFIPRMEGDRRVLFGSPYEASNPNGTINLYDPAASQIIPWTTELKNLFYFFGDNDDNPSFPFMTSDIYGINSLGVAGYPAEQVHQWADVDNTGDELRDSMWIPIPADVFLPNDGIDNNLNGLVDERQDNGINHDCDFCCDRPDLYSGDPAFPCADYEYKYNEGRRRWEVLRDAAGAPILDPDEAIESGVFVYNGCCDGLDNNGNGLVDEPEEDKLFLSAPLPGIWVPVDLNGDGRPDMVPTWDGTAIVEVPLRVRVPDPIYVQVIAPDGTPQTVALGPGDVDVLDNDYDMFVNNYNTYAYVGPNRNLGINVNAFVSQNFSDTPVGLYAPPYRLKGFTVSEDKDWVKPIVSASAVNQESARDYSVWQLPGNWDQADVDLYITQRAASYTDINILTAMGGYGLLQYEPTRIVWAFKRELDGTINILQEITTADLLGNSVRITHSGEPVCELAGRAAIYIADEASKVNLNIAGAHVYSPVDADGDAVPSLWRALGDGAGTWEYETRMLPQLGVIRARNLWGLLMGSPDGRALNDAPLPEIPYRYDASLPGYGRVDDNGMALLAALTGAPNYLRIPNTDSNRDPRDPDQLYEELRLDPFGLHKGIDDPQELRRFNPRRNLIAERDGADNNNSGVADEPGELGDRQLQNIQQTQQANQIGDEIFNDLRPFITVHSTDRNAGFLTEDTGVVRAANQLDFNQATPQQIAVHLLKEGGFEPFFRLAEFIGTPETTNFAMGLRQQNTLRAPADGMLRTQLDGPTANIVPGDPQLAVMQTAATIVDARDSDHARTELTTPRLDLIAENTAYAPWPQELNLRERVAQESIFPAEEVQAHFNALGLNIAVDTEDHWWARMVASDKVDIFGDPVGEGRRFQHTIAGLESIRINELMVRPVRRVEAEMDYGFVNFNPQPYAGMPGFILTVMQTRWNGAAYAIPYAVQDPPISAPWYRASGLNPWTGAYETALGDLSVLRNDGTTDPIEFIFQESEGLPAGRYYLKINTIDENRINTINGGGQLAYVIKYVNTAAGDPTILEDVASATLTDADWVPVPSAHIGGRPGEPEGWVFLDGTPRDPVVPDLVALNDPSHPDYGNAQIAYVRRNYHRDAHALTPLFGNPVNPGEITGLQIDGDPAGPNRRTHTVWVPPAGTGYALCVALRRVDGGPLAVNFFDFSQEPDHEWIEITNISDAPVDLGGWELEIGIPDPPNVNELTDPPLDTFKSRWRVPENTTIAAKGYLLLSFDSTRLGLANAKFDKYKTDATLNLTTNLINANGIGLAAGVLAPGEAEIPDISGVTVPPLFDASSNYGSGSLADFFDPTGSVFRRDYLIEDPPMSGNLVVNPNFKDYVDNHGDGIAALRQNVLTRLWRDIIRDGNDIPRIGAAERNIDQYAVDQGIRIEELNIDIPGIVSTPQDGPRNNVQTRASKPWDRIVALQNLQLWRENPLDPKSKPVTLDDITTVDMVARVVLRGGVLPNYPERDGIDNDGDGGYLEWGLARLAPDDPTLVDVDMSGIAGDAGDRIPINYVPGTLDRDMVDNDLNGLVDERGIGLIRGHTYSFPNPRRFVNEYDGDLPHNPFFSEGVDEGRPNAFRRYGPGSYEAGTLPIAFFNNRSFYSSDLEYLEFDSFYYPPVPPRYLFCEDYSLDPAAEYVNPSAWRVDPYSAVFPFPLDINTIGQTAAQEVCIQLQRDMNDVMRPGRKYLTTIVFDYDSSTNSGFIQVRLGDKKDIPQNSGLWRPPRTSTGPYYETLSCEADFESNLYVIAQPDTFCRIAFISVRPVHGPKGIGAASAISDGLLSRFGDKRDEISKVAQGDYRYNVIGGLSPQEIGQPGDARYLGTDEDPPEWKAFVERRWNPGDNVIVTLYEGMAESGRVADRVTYREYDVINRTIDDVMSTPYTSSDALGNPVGPICLHPAYTRLWLPDHMGLDFYRSLERKHPLDPGDRFGTSNRWEPTDGNYDDWAESMSVFADMLSARSNYDNALLTGSGIPFSRFGDDESIRLLRHGLYASPLRMNFLARTAENPPDLYRVYSNDDLLGGGRPYGQFRAYDEAALVFEHPDTVDYTVPLVQDPPPETIRRNQDWAIAQALFPNAPLGTGALTRLPLFARTQTLFNTAASVTDADRRFIQAADNPNMVLVKAFSPGDAALEYQATTLHGSILGRQFGVEEAVWEGVAATATQESVVLSIAEARYTPIRPDPRRISSGPDLNELLQWRNETGNLWRAPGIWSPIFLFELPGDAAQTVLPAYPDGFPSGAAFGRNYLFSNTYLANLDGFFGAMTPAELAARWPLAARAVMYVSEARAGVEGINSPGGRPEPMAPEALFTWDSGTGLENGEYYLYVGTFLPGFGNQMRSASSMWWQDASNFVENILLPLDQPGAVSGSRFKPVLALEVITDPTRAQGLAPEGGADNNAGLTYPADWVPPTRYEPRTDGLIPYGDTGSGAWQPRTVRVTDNFLALRVRNVGAPGEVGVLTHVVLTPRKRTPGKININTAENHLVEIGQPGGPGHEFQFFNPIMGLPGAVRALETVRANNGNIIGQAIPPDADIALPSAPVVPGSPLPAPAEFTGGRAVPPLRNTIENPDRLADNADQIGIAAMRLAALMTANRPKNYDGRYYENITGLLRDDANNDVYPLSNEDDPEQRFDEVVRRFRQMVNLITIRSDVFEIIATVQAGYGVDLDGDGFFNYRSNDEFITTAESKVRLVYERRAPAARSDEAAER